MENGQKYLHSESIFSSGQLAVIEWKENVTMTVSILMKLTADIFVLVYLKDNII